MPFTLSHTVAVIPLYKYLGKFGAFSALIIGSMIPDFAYLTPFLVDQRVESHSLLGVYLYCIPMGLTVYFLYHLLMAPVLVSVFPPWIQKHLHADLFEGRLPNIPSYALILSLVVGALTHIFWDYFTHYSGIPQLIWWMDEPLATVDDYQIMPYRVLQHVSSIFGLSLLMFWIWKWLAARKVTPPLNGDIDNPSHWQAPHNLRRLSKWLLLLVPTLTGLFLGFKYMPDSQVMYGIYDAQIFVRFAIIGAAAAFLVLSISLGLLYQLCIYRDR